MTNAETPAIEEIVNERDLNFCPVHGEELSVVEEETGDFVGAVEVAKCPTCGPVSIDFWRTGVGGEQ